MAAMAAPISPPLRLVVTEIINPSHFWARIGTDSVLADFAVFEEAIAAHCATAPRCCDADTLEVGQLLLGRCERVGKWLRAVVSTVDSDEVDVLFVDYYITEFVLLSDLIADVPPDIQQRPAQAWKCTLASIRPIASTWIQRAIMRFTDLVLERTLEAKTPIIDHDTLVVDILIPQEDGSVSSVSDIFLSEGLGIPVVSGEDKTIGKQSGSSQNTLIPRFNLERLDMALQTEQQESNEKDKPPDYEQQAFTAGIEKIESPGYECSDLEISRGGVPPISRDVIGGIHDEIREMREHTARKKEMLFGSPSGSDNSSTTNVRSTPPRSRSPAGRGYASPARVSSPLVGVRSSPVRERNPTWKGGSPKVKLRRHDEDRGIRRREAFMNDRDSPATGSLFTRDAELNNNNNKSTVSAKASNESSRLAAEKTSATAKSGREFHERHRDEFMSEVRTIMASVQRDGLDACQQRLVQMIYPVSCVDGLEPTELDICMDMLVKEAIVNSEFCPAAIQLISAFSELEHFAETVNSQMWKYHRAYIKVSSSPRLQAYCRAFCTFLGRLFVASSDWRHADCINSTLMRMLWKWSLFNKHNKHPNPNALLCLYADCLLTYFAEARQAMEQRLPIEMDELYEEIEARLQTSVLPCVVKEKLQLLVQKRHQSVGDVAMEDETEEDESNENPPAEEMLTITTQMNQDMDTSQSLLVDTAARDHDKDRHMILEDASVKEPAKAGLKDVHVQTCPEITTQCDKCIQVSLPSASTDEIPSTSDQYAKVKNMLADLKLTELLPVFTSNAIRDSLLGVDFCELKELLKECGFLAGQIMEIKCYLARPNRRSLSMDPTPDVERPSSCIAMETTSPLTFAPVLFSPQDFVACPQKNIVANIAVANSAVTPSAGVISYSDVSLTNTGADKVGIAAVENSLSVVSINRETKPKPNDAAVSVVTNFDTAMNSAPFMPAENLVRSLNAIEVDPCWDPVAKFGSAKSSPISCDENVPDSWLELASDVDSGGGGGGDGGGGGADKNNGRLKTQKSANHDAMESSPAISPVVTRQLECNNSAIPKLQDSLDIRARCRKSSPRSIKDITLGWLRSDETTSLSDLPPEGSSSKEWAKLESPSSSSSIMKLDEWPRLGDEPPALPPPPPPPRPIVNQMWVKARAPSPAPVVTSKFGERASQTCTICGSRNHLIYDCPEHRSKFLLG